MTYYDRIARQWHMATGHKGGAFKSLLLNDVLIESISDIDGRAVLELGAGNGYFIPQLLRRREGQIPGELVITDISTELLGIAEKEFRVRQAKYLQLDVRRDFPFPDRSFDVVLAVMLFNELSDGGVRRALGECKRILTESGVLIGAVVHPDFVASLDRRGELRRVGRGRLTMPGTSGLVLPVVPRSRKRYERLFHEAGFELRVQDLRPTEAVLKMKRGLRNLGKHPVALVFEACLPAANEISA